MLEWYEDPTKPVSTGYILAVALFVVGMIGNALIANHNYHRLYTLGMNARTTLNALVYRKVRRRRHVSFCAC
jgi:hypothetical protein